MSCTLKTIAVIWLTLLLAPSGLEAQVVRGTVLDSLQAVPLRGVAVSLLSPREVVARAVTDDSGRFELPIPASGQYRFRAQHIGYRVMLSEALPIDASRDATITLLLVSLPVALEPIAVSASSQIFLQNNGFYERKRSEPGYFMEPEATIAAASKARQTADVVEGIPGVTLMSAGGSRGIRIPQFTGRSGIGCDNGPKILLDNHVMNPGAEPFDVNTIQPDHLLAIEIYRHVSEVPLRFGGTEATCGVIVFWTKH